MGIASEALKKFKRVQLKNLPRSNRVRRVTRSCPGSGEVLLCAGNESTGHHRFRLERHGEHGNHHLALPPKRPVGCPGAVAFREKRRPYAVGMNQHLKALNRKGKQPPETVFVAYGGDGARPPTSDSSLKRALERGHNFIYLSASTKKL